MVSTYEDEHQLHLVLISYLLTTYVAETRIRYVTKFDYTSTYTSPSGQVTKTDHYKKVPEEYEVRVDTHSAKGSLIYLDWEDASVHVKRDEIEQHQGKFLHTTIPYYKAYTNRKMSQLKKY